MRRHRIGKGIKKWKGEKSKEMKGELDGEVQGSGEKKLETLEEGRKCGESRRKVKKGDIEGKEEEKEKHRCR